MQCFIKLTLRFVYECLIKTLLDTFTKFMYKRNEKIYLIFFYFYQMWQWNFWGRGDFDGSVGKGKQTKFYFRPYRIKRIDWLIDYSYCFTSLSRIFHFYGDVTITGEGLQNLGLCSALKAFEQGGILVVAHLLWHGTLVFPVSSEGPPHSVASYGNMGVVEDLF
jgi:hypothetical protein